MTSVRFGEAPVNKRTVKCFAAFVVPALLAAAACEFEVEPEYPGGPGVHVEEIMRQAHATLVFDGRMWVLGGRTGTSQASEPFWFHNDVHWSTDGLTWRLMTRHAQWGRRCSHAAAVFNGRMWVMGGTWVDGTLRQCYSNDIWISSNGAEWTFVGLAPWSPRADHAAVVHKGRLYVLGGQSGTISYHSDVWSTPDGVNWRKEADGVFDSAEARGLAAPAVVSYNGNILVVGGAGVNRPPGSVYGYVIWRGVWSSADGRTWRRSPPTGDNSWGSRASHRAAVFRNRVWIHGGAFDGDYPWPGMIDTYYYDLHYTEGEGDLWTRAFDAAAGSFQARAYHSFIAYDGYLWIFMGIGASIRTVGPDPYGQTTIIVGTALQKEVWRSADGLNWRRLY